jgi:hypothetical protein
MGRVIASGGVESIVGDYKIHKFITNGTFTVNCGGEIEILIVGGGGAGGTWCGGGGGAGGVLYENSHIVVAKEYTVIIGNGAPRPSANGRGANGQNSFFDGMNAVGGGGGGNYSVKTGIDGGSGGGGSYTAGSAGGRGAVGAQTQGYNGGIAGANYLGGGGGGSAEIGNTNGGGFGGDGSNNYSDLLIAADAGIDIDGIRYIAGGGGGWVNAGNDSIKPGGAGGGGAGGSSKDFSGNLEGVDGTPNTGGGGGGGHYHNYSLHGGAGGSGIVIIRYKCTLFKNYLCRNRSGNSIGITLGIPDNITPAYQNYLIGSRSRVGNSILGISDEGSIILNPPPVSLFHFNGTDNSTIFTDEMGKSWTYAGTAHIDTGNKRFGNACLSLDGNSDNLVGPSEDIDFDFGTGDYTIDCWVYLNSNAVYSGIIDGRTSATYQNYVFGIYNLSGTNRLDALDSSGRLTGTSTSVPLLIWTHVAWVRSSGVVMCFVNGNKDVTTRSYSSAFNMTRANMLIGKIVDGNFLNGYIDELCISKGIARWTESFTPPIKPYSIVKTYKNYLIGCRSRTGDSKGTT